MFTSGDNSLTKENILKRLDSYQLFKAYCSNFKEIDRKFKSEFRKDDEPSCTIIYYEGDLFYKDFGEKGYRVFDYIGRKFGLDYLTVLQKINIDFGLGLGYANSTDHIQTSLVIPEKSNTDLSSYQKEGTIIEIEPRGWTQADKKYWNEYKIPLRLLEYHNIKSIASYALSNKQFGRSFRRINPYALAYSIDYYWSGDIFRRKLYFPQSKVQRFASNVDSTIVQGWKLLPKCGGNILFVTKSYKDILIFNLLGYWAIAPNNEGAFIPDHVMEKLKTRWKCIYVWFDNDEGGIAGAERFANRFDLPYTYNPLGEPKDPSDFVKKYDLRKFDNLITKFLQHVS